MVVKERTENDCYRESKRRMLDFFLITKNRGVVVVVVVLAARCLVAACVGIMMPSKQCESASNP